MDRITPRFYEFGPFRLDTQTMLLSRNGEPVRLMPKACMTLVILITYRERVVTKEELMRELWGSCPVEENNLNFNISVLREALGDTPHNHRYILTVPRQGYRFVSSVREFEDEAVAPVEPVGGAVALESPFYIERPADVKFRSAVRRREGLVRIKGASQSGKTSLLARGLQTARAAGARIVLTDFMQFSASDVSSAERLLLRLADDLAHHLELESSPKRGWKSDRSPSNNIESYLQYEVFVSVTPPIVWCFDGVDRLFTCDFGSEVFALLRSWYNKRALNPKRDWFRLTLALAYATEAYLFISDPFLSPFNVGIELHLEDFTLEQVTELNRRHDSPLRNDNEVRRFFELVGGHPYLANRGLAWVKEGDLNVAELEAQAENDEGWFSDHLRRVLVMLRRDEALTAALRSVLSGQPCPNVESFYRLRSAGVIVGDSVREAKPRCRLYARYLERNL